MLGACTFQRYYSVMTKALTICLNQRGDAGSLHSCMWLLQRTLKLPSLMREFKYNGGPKGRNQGKSPSQVFPLPPLSRSGSLVTGVGDEADVDNLCAYYGGNMVVAALNWMHGERVERFDILSAAHGRVHSRIERILRAFVMTDMPILDHEGLDSYLRQTQCYTGAGVVLALGVKGGVPSKAADVTLAKHLGNMYPEMGEQVVNPRSLLLPSKRRPKKLRRGYTWLSPSYPELVKRNVKAGLHRYKKPSQVAKHNGKRVLAGAFAVVKDADEDRVITDPAVNQLLDPERLPRPKFAYIPMSRAVTVPRGGVILASKRDARHYFHRLQIGRRWEKWLCGPPVRLVSRRGDYSEVFPASRSTPMGFGPSAGWAQGLTDVVTHDAALPEDCRLHPDHVVPGQLPIWGSIIDDIWALEHADEPDSGNIGPSWLSQAEAAWCARGVEPNVKKSVDGLADQEVQGYFIHSRDHWVGVSLDKRRCLFQASMQVLLKKYVIVGVVGRLIGKHSFMHSCRPSLRSIFDCTYRWIQGLRERRRDRVQIPNDVWQEICVSTILIPFAQFDLSASWSHRIECSDASMTGLGRAFGIIPPLVAQWLARYSSHLAVYTNLKLPWGIGLTQEHKCPMKKVRIPVERIRWKYLGVPWESEHITLSEADAIAWTAEDRLRRPVDDDSRFIHPVDSAACCGAFSKGRSSSSRLNSRCRKVCSVNLAGGHDVFYPWMSSGENPADTPSRWYEPSSAASLPQVELASSEPVADLRELGPWPTDTWFFIHFCSGSRRDHDLLDEIEILAGEHGLSVVGIAVDPLASLDGLHSMVSPPSLHGDLFNVIWGDWLMRLIQSKRVAGAFGSPPCNTLSAARHVPLKVASGMSPRPLRSRQSPWYPLSYCTDRERLAVHVGSALYLLVLGLLGEVAMTGGWTGLGHPADRGEPLPSFFATKEVHSFCRTFGLVYSVIHQCRYGAPTKKPTGLLLPRGLHKLQLRCNHHRKHKWLVGLDNYEHFETIPAAKYPRKLCNSLATLFVQSWLEVRSRGFERPRAPKCSVSYFPSPWQGAIDGTWAWPEPVTGFLVELVKAVNNREVHPSFARPQQ